MPQTGPPVGLSLEAQIPEKIVTCKKKSLQMWKKTERSIY
jgi:hypothetical protein